ncbi:MAG: ATP-binding protein [Parvularcula sp.]|jgi:hypothetical protein|nr:ATP-binding protein [Parvularcula sp.]
MTKNSPGFRAQEAYVDTLSDQKFPYSLAVGAAFVRGMREIGYKSTATALCELIDNSEQAGATRVDIVFGYDSGNKKPARLALIDDGHGMSPRMLRAAVLWGGTHRENDRTGFGRFGYGLPSACVSQGRSFTVYSRPARGDWFSVTVDLEEIAAGKYTNAHGLIVVPEATASVLPEFVQEAIGAHADLASFSGTVVLIDQLDKIDRRTTSKLVDVLLTQFGVIYHKISERCQIRVNGRLVEPIDPLFLTPGYRWFDYDEDRAVRLPPISVKVKPKEDGSSGGTINVRLSFLPYGFQLIDKSKKGGSAANLNPRFYVMRDYNSVIVCRNGRVIEVKGSTPWTSFQNNDRHVRAEVDFPASLDDEFAVNTSKQRVDLSERIWDHLREAGVEEAISQLRRLYKNDQRETSLREERTDGDRLVSEAVMEAVHEDLPPGELERHLRRDPEEDLFREARRQEADGVVPFDVALNSLKASLEGRTYKLGHRSVPGDPFFKVEQFGPTTMMWLNTSHAWYETIYFHPEATPQTRRAWELMLFVVAERAASSTQSQADFYRAEIEKWSERLTTACDVMVRTYSNPDASTADHASADAAS